MGILEEPHERQVCWNEEREEHRSKYDLGTDQKKKPDNLGQVGPSKDFFSLYRLFQYKRTQLTIFQF